MLIRTLSLKDFRNYEVADVDFTTGPNLFAGSNGQGKTNLIEAIGYLSTLGSHRVANDSAMIGHGADAAVVRARIENGKQALVMEVQLNRAGQNRAQVNGSAVRPRDLPRYFSTVLFAPEDIALVRAEPSGRRSFLDRVLVLRTPRLAGVIADYDRVLKQRNSLLKSARSSSLSPSQFGTLEIWDERLTSLGSELVEARSVLVSDLAPEFAKAYEAVAGANQDAALAYLLSILSSSDDEEDTDALAIRADRIGREEAREFFAKAIGRLRKAELARGLTLVGPHRDDLIVQLNGVPARGFASHGESWSLALALKLASAELLRRESATGDPVLILDDVFAELDELRRARLADAVASFEQVLITAAVLDDVPPALAGKIVRIAGGRIVTEGGES
jgi:DNA replication and repair protein RecF